LVLPDGTELEDSIPLEHYALPRMAAVQVELKQQPLGAAPLAGAGEARVRRLAGEAGLTPRRPLVRRRLRRRLRRRRRPRHRRRCARLCGALPW